MYESFTLEPCNSLLTASVQPCYKVETVSNPWFLQPCHNVATTCAQPIFTTLYTGGNNLATTLPYSYGQVCAVEQVVVVGYNSLVLELKDLAKRQSQDTDMAGMIAYLKDGTLPDDERSSHRVVLESKHFELVDEVLYHKNAVFPGR